jgi:hypothetical protein
MKLQTMKHSTNIYFLKFKQIINITENGKRLKSNNHLLNIKRKIIIKFEFLIFPKIYFWCLTKLKVLKWYTLETKFYNLKQKKWINNSLRLWLTITYKIWKLPFFFINKKKMYKVISFCVYFSLIYKISL